MEKIRLWDVQIRTKLLLAFLFVALVMLCILVIAVINLQGVIALNSEIKAEVLNPLEHLSSARMILERIKLDGRDILQTEDTQVRLDIIDGAIARTPRIIENLEAFHTTIVREQAFELYDQLMTKMDIYEAELSHFRMLIINEEININNFLSETLSPISDECLEIMAQLNTIKLDTGRSLALQSSGISQTARFWLIASSVAGLMIAVAIGIYMSIAISRPIVECMGVLTKAADGDFTVRLPENNNAEIRKMNNAANSLIEFCNMSISTISDAVVKLRESAQYMLSISSDLAVTSKELCNQTSAVSASSEEFSAGMTESAKALSTANNHVSAIAASIEEINATISIVAAAAEETSTRVDQSSALVDEIQESIVKASGSVKQVSFVFNSVAQSVEEINKSITVVSEHSVDAMNKVADADDKANNTNEIIKRLEVASKQIGKIVNVINDIADQTNMLALNAAIEAAGAGEAGKGFMVVANEVKELAKQTAEATDEIANQIENMQNNVPEAVGAVMEITAIINSMTEYINSSAAEISQQGKRSDEITAESAAAAQSMNEIATEISRISENAQSVTRAVNESNKGVNEIARSTAELVIGSQEIAGNSERASVNMGEIYGSTSEMATGLEDISNNIQLISREADVAQESADSVKETSEKLLETAHDMDKFVSGFKTTK
jgi:methyl-accepting chemotaxis protein